MESALEVIAKHAVTSTEKLRQIASQALKDEGEND